MIAAEVIHEALDELAMMPFFPSEPGVKAKIGELIGKMCRTEEQVRWLAKKATTTGDGKWKGPVVLRQMLCSRYPPVDGIEVSYTEDYPEGIPSDDPVKNLGICGASQLFIAGEIAPESQEILSEVTSEIPSMPKPSKAELEASRRFFIENGLEALCPKK